MRKRLTHLTSLLTIIGLSFCLPINAGTPANKTDLKQEAASIVKTFGGSLKPRLIQAIQSGGLPKAVEVCATEAPKIAQQLSQESGWDVRRVSLKPRNKSNATADNWEQKILNQFEQRLAQGEQTATLIDSAIVDHQFRFMKAQVVEPLCLNCHGQSLNTQVKQLIIKHYPDDMATGYSLGQIRGAFSLTKDLKNRGTPE